MSIHQLQTCIARPIRRQRVGSRVIAVEPILAILISAKLATQVIGALVIRILKVVFAIRAGLPNVKDGAGNGLAGEQVSNGAVHFADAAAGGRILDDRGTVVAKGSIRRPKGA